MEFRGKLVRVCSLLHQAGIKLRSRLGSKHLLLAEPFHQHKTFNVTPNRFCFYASFRLSRELVLFGASHLFCFVYHSVAQASLEPLLLMFLPPEP